MKRLLEALHGARKIEWFLLAILIVVLVLYLTGGEAGMRKETELESRLRDILRKVEGAGDAEVMVYQGESAVPEGVLIVTDGAADIPTRLRLQQAAHTLLGLDISRIEIVRGDHE